MEVFHKVVHYILNFEVKDVNQMADAMGPSLYVLLFLIVFCETGLVVTPILPGDSLLFALGVWAGQETPHPLASLPLLIVLLIVAAVLGDSVNYWLGQRYGTRLFQSDTSRLFNKKHLIRTQDFYAKYGGKAIILGRFMPIVRTFVPFVAGIGQMNFRKFWLYNVCGGAAWILLFLIGGWKFGSYKLVRENFTLVVVAIVIISIMPAVIEYFLARRRAAQKQEPVSAN